jgi:hypothetical protein
MAARTLLFLSIISVAFGRLPSVQRFDDGNNIINANLTVIVNEDRSCNNSNSKPVAPQGVGRTHYASWNYDALSVRVKKNNRPFTPPVEFAIPIDKYKTIVEQISNPSNQYVFSQSGVIDLKKSRINSGDVVVIKISYKEMSVDWTSNERNDYGIGVVFLLSDSSIFNTPNVNVGSRGFNDILVKESQVIPHGRNIGHSLSMLIPDGVAYLELVPSPMFSYEGGIHTYMNLDISDANISIEIVGTLPVIEKSP